ncbi:MAG: tRNA pseudouridine(55) synthase TruB [Clostridia bacterium]|nr:tRNA pseudouridine(55) synthase TruB [Clostridia bacterium]
MGKTGPVKDGIINVYKPGGMTSNDVIYKLRQIIGIRKIGHTGTLDPMAEGVLPVMINRASRINEYLDRDLKTYEASLVLGIRTDSLDVTGKVLETSGYEGVTEDDVIGAVKSLFRGGAQQKTPVSFSGVISQLPPLASAVRIDGRHLYEYVHSDEEMPEDVLAKLRHRRVWIDEISVDGVELPQVKLTIRCSKGTYIRSIVRDIGEALGCGAAMSGLKRTASGAFTMEDAVTVMELAEAAQEAGLIDIESREPLMIRRHSGFGDSIPEPLTGFVKGIDYPLGELGEVLVSRETAGKFFDGWHIDYRDCRILKEPEQAAWMERLSEEEERYDREERERNGGSHAGLKLHSEFLRTYRICYDDPAGDRIFVGTAAHSDRYHKLVADKVFLREHP